MVPAPSQAVCLGSFSFIYRARLSRGQFQDLPWAGEGAGAVLDPFALSPEWLFSFQAALQHSNKKGFAMQRKTSHPPLSSVWAESRAGSSCATLL